MELLDVLLIFEATQKNYDALIPHAGLRKSQIKKALATGCVRSVGRCLVCDEDGGIKHPERYKEGFELTEKGRDLLEAERAKDLYRRKSAQM